MRKYFDIPSINSRFEFSTPSTVYEIHNGGHRSNTPVVYKPLKNSSEWTIYLTGKKLSEVAHHNRYLKALNDYLN